MRYLPHLVLALVLLAAGIGVGERIVAANREAYEARIRLAEAHAAAMVAHADSAVVRARDAERRERAWRDSADARSARVVERIRYVREELPPAPDTCSTWIAARDTIIDELGRESLDLRLALAAQDTAIEDLHTAIAALRSANDSLSAALDDRPRPVSGIKLGGFGGVCLNGRPCAGVGVVVPVDPLELLRRLF